MMRKMDMLWIGAKTRIHNFWEDFKTEEKGAAEIGDYSDHCCCDCIGSCF